jgi:hypothetical protein
VFGEVVETAGSGDDDVGGPGGVLEFGFVLFKRNSSEVAAVSQFRLLEIAAYIEGYVPNLLKSL